MERQKLLPSPATRRRERYKLMCCPEREEPKPGPIPYPPSNASSEDLYSATPPRKALPKKLEDASLYPDPLKLTKKLLSLDIKTRHLSNASRLSRGRRNSVGVPAELEAEPVHPPTRSTSCSSLPRYESIANLPPLPRRRVGSGRPPPSRYRQGRRHASVPIVQDEPGSVQKRCRAASAGHLENPSEKTPAATTLPSTPTFVGRKPADEALRVAQPTKTRKRVQYAIKVSDRTWFERDKEDTTAEILDQERIRYMHLLTFC